MDDAGHLRPAGRGPVEVLELGPQPRPGGRGRRWALALLLAVLVLAASGAVAARLRESAEPTFSREEVVRLYTEPPAQARRLYGWDPDTLSTDADSDAEAPRPRGTDSTACGRIATPDLEPDGVDQAGVSLRAVLEDGTTRAGGVALTVRFPDPAAARERFRAVNTDLSSCTAVVGDEAGTSGQTGPRPRFRIESPALGQDGRGGSRSTFRVRIEGVQAPFLVTFVRFGNTLSFLAHRDGRGAAEKDEALADLVVRELRAIHADRR